MRTVVWETGYANTKITKNQLAGKLKPVKPLNFVKKFLLLVITLVLAGVIFMLGLLILNKHPVKQTMLKARRTGGKSYTITENEISQNSVSGSNTSSNSVKVNNQSIPVPNSGSYNETVDVPGGQVNVSGNSSQSSDGPTSSNKSSSTVNVNVGR